MIVTILICLALAFVCFGVMDELAHHFNSVTVSFIKNNPKFWDKRISWKNKWYNNKNGTVYSEMNVERFWGSSRWFVFLTDGWHLMQFISYQLLSLAIALALVDQYWVALLLSLPLHIGCSTIKSLTMKVV